MGGLPRAMVAGLAAVLLAGCGVVSPLDTPVPALSTTPLPPAATSVPPDAALRGTAPAGFAIGAAVAGGGHHTTAGYPDPFSTDAVLREQLATEFNSLTPENQLKWEFVHPEENTYDFGPADQIVDYAGQYGESVRGHTLLWHSQNPAWLPVGEVSDEDLLAILHDHITTVVGHFAGRIRAWDVANEILADDGRPREENPWIARFGIDVVADAFRWAHEADPAAVLYLNDYGIEDAGPKADAYYVLAQRLLAEGVPLGGMGFESHLSFDYPFPSGLRQSLQRFADLGLEVAITELDVRMPVDPAPSPELQDEQARWFADVVDACLAVTACGSVTLWGTTDRYSWVPSAFPGEGFATPWNDDYTRKPAYKAILGRLAEGR
ncbi:MAG: endo-1,4-beta-xylanase [Propionicimonas sp.]|nr:endo-1,4-beta-xylanase [Propionicimonas sp.]